MEMLFEAKNLCKTFRHKAGLFGSELLYAVKNVTFNLRQGQTLAIIGENGSGKSTVAKLLAGLMEPSDGTMWLDQKPLLFHDYQYRCQNIRMIAQNPHSFFNPRLNVGQILDTPLKLNTSLTPIEREQRINQTLKQVGLYPELVDYYPRTMAVGQKQRIALARALILEPKIIIADEAFASLDMTVKAQIFNLMMDLQKKSEISYIYITQDLSMVKHISDNILVMQQGEVVESGKTLDVLENPKQDITKKLISSQFFERKLECY